MIRIITKMIHLVMKRILLIQFIILLVSIPVSAQNDQQDIEREVTLYNPYKPSLLLVKKRSYLPAMNDTFRRMAITTDIKCRNL